MNANEIHKKAIELNNLAIYEAVRAVPEEAKKKIGGGRLKGMTDINPMWRVKALTQLFGPCGTGWKVDNVSYFTQNCGETKETAVFCELELRYFDAEKNEWSSPLYGIGGSMLIVKETGGIRLDDEAYKKAHTDAISVACKALGIGADVYWSSDNTKYTNGVPEDQAKQANAPVAPVAPATPANQANAINCSVCNRPIEVKHVTIKGTTTTYSPEFLIKKSTEVYGKCMCYECMCATKEASKKAAG